MRDLLRHTVMTKKASKLSLKRLIESSSSLVERMKADPELEFYIEEALEQLSYGDFELSDASQYVIDCLEELYGDEPDWHDASLDVGVWVEDEISERVQT